MHKMVKGGRQLFIAAQTLVPDHALSPAFLRAMKLTAGQTLRQTNWPVASAFWGEGAAFNDILDYLKRGGS